MGAGHAALARRRLPVGEDRLSRQGSGCARDRRCLRSALAPGLHPGGSEPEPASGSLQLHAAARGGRHHAVNAAAATAPTPADAPLAERLRPRSIHDVIGQPQLLGEGKPLRVAFESGHPHSMILWGPPGTGKTTLARLMADAFDAQFIAISAVLGGVKD